MSNAVKGEVNVCCRAGELKSGKEEVLYIGSDSTSASKFVRRGGSTGASSASN